MPIHKCGAEVVSAPPEPLLGLAFVEPFLKILDARTLVAASATCKAWRAIEQRDSKVLELFDARVQT